jgi:hypothetical protein
VLPSHSPCSNISLYDLNWCIYWFLQTNAPNISNFRAKLAYFDEMRIKKAMQQAKKPQKHMIFEAFCHLASVFTA